MTECGANCHRIERRMNDHAINAFAQLVVTSEILTPCLELTRLVCSIMAGLARYFGWKNWVFETTSCRFKSLVPNGLVKVPHSFPEPMTSYGKYTKLSEIGVSLVEFCMAVCRKREMSVLMLYRYTSALSRTNS